MAKNDVLYQGNTEEALMDSLAEMDRMFSTANTYMPSFLKIWSLMSVRPSKDCPGTKDYWFVGMDPDEIDAEELILCDGDKSPFVKRDEVVKRSEKWLAEEGILPYIDNIEEVGFYLEYYEHVVSEILIPDKELPATFYKTLGFGSAPTKGIDLLRDVYVASVMGGWESRQKTMKPKKTARDSRPDITTQGMRGVTKTTETDGVKLLFGFFSTLTRSNVKEVRELLDAIKKRHTVSVREFEIKSKTTVVDLVYDELSSKELPFSFGVRFEYSDMGNCSYTLEEMLYYKEHSVRLGKVATHKHTNGNNLKKVEDGFMKKDGTYIRPALKNLFFLSKKTFPDAETANKAFWKIFEDSGIQGKLGNARVGKLMEDVGENVITEANSTFADLITHLIVICKEAQTRDYLAVGLEQLLGSVILNNSF